MDLGGSVQRERRVLDSTRTDSCSPHTLRTVTPSATLLRRCARTHTRTQVEWSEPWILGLLFFHLSTFLVILWTRRWLLAQAALLVVLASMCLATEHINEWAATNYRWALWSVCVCVCAHHLWRSGVTHCGGRQQWQCTTTSAIHTLLCDWNVCEPMRPPVQVLLQASVL